jgi:DNA polymerase III epsilon subunit-like protein
MIACVFDTETTGLIENHSRKLARQPEVIEFACVWADWDDLVNVKNQFECMVRPSQPLPDKVKSITGITDEDLKSHPSFTYYATAIESHIVSADVVVAHNLSYDMEMLDLEFERIGRTLEWPTIRVCTVEQSIHLTGNRIKLGDLHRFLLGREHREAHRAMPDVLATLDVLREMRSRGWL